MFRGSFDRFGVNVTSHLLRELFLTKFQRKQKHTHNQKTTTMTTFMPTTTNSTIFKRHETRHLHQPQPVVMRTMKIESVDNTFGETLRKMKTRSTIYQMHQQRHATIPAASKRQQDTTQSSSNGGHSFLEWMSQSTIYRRHAKRAASQTQC